MPPQVFRIALLLLGCLFIFMLTAGILIQVMPAKKTTVDWLIVGSVSTLLTLLGLFLALITTWFKPVNPFGVRRPKTNLPAVRDGNGEGKGQ